jgi:hypothetical protein
VTLLASHISGINSYHVVVSAAGITSSAVLEGFTVSAGQATFPHHRGGGMQNDGSSSPTLTNIVFTGNSTLWGGGGMYNRDSSPSLTNVAFSGNNAKGDGGGLFNRDISSPTLTNVTFSGNRAIWGRGGGMFNSNPILSVVTPDSKSSAFDGRDPAKAHSGPTIRNSIFWNNGDASGIGTTSASVYSIDVIIFVHYSLIQGCKPNGSWQDACGYNGGGNLPDQNPLFIDTPDPTTAPTLAGNLRLQAGSPAIDAGNSSYLAGVVIDLDGNWRLVGSAVDLGPYEWQKQLFLPLVRR